jgi:signal transduction histidine kinase
MRYRNRFQFGLTLLVALFLLAALFAILLFAFTPETPAARGPLLLASFIAILIGGLLCILFVLRWVLRPYRQLVGEAKKASVESKIPGSKDEAEFVLETFQSVVAQLQDQRKQLERLTAQASERADSAERLSERIVASMPSALIAFDGEGRSMAINVPGRELLRLDGNALNQPFRKLLEKYPRLSEMVDDCLQTGTLYRREELEVTGAGGEPLRFGATIAPIDLAADRVPRGALCLLTDITEVTQLREQVALKRDLENLGEMSAGLAHEFKNSIAALHGYVQLLQNLELNERGRVAADSLLNEVRNLAEMVSSFLNFARPQPLDLEPVSLLELIRECEVELAQLYREHKVELVFQSTGNTQTDLLEIPGDERMLRQALLNLLRNSAEAIPEDNSQRAVFVRMFREQERGGMNRAIIEIEDTGSGIPQDQLEKIFIPFFTTKAKGHGVGLALAHRVITQHGGTLTATNSPRGGAVFRIGLPA